MNILTGIKCGFSAVKIFCKQKSPEILLGLGITAGVGAFVLGCKASIKADSVVKKAEHDMARIDDILENPEEYEDGEEYTEEIAKTDRVGVKKNLAIDLIKLYGPALLVGCMSIVCILSSHKILSARNAALATVANTSIQALNNYRSNVRDAFGEEIDRQLMSNKMVKKDISEGAKDEGHHLENKDYDDPWRSYSEDDIYKLVYEDPYIETGYQQRDPIVKLMFLERMQDQCNEKLKAKTIIDMKTGEVARKGAIFLNDVKDMLGAVNKDNPGHHVGWVWSEGDNYISFGLEEEFDMLHRYLNCDDADEAAKLKEEVLMAANHVVLNFNVQGVISNRTDINY